MTEAQVKYFLLLAAHKNMTKAAKQLNVSQPAFSKQILALEKDLGFILFDRFNSGVELTAQGQIFHELFLNFEQQLKSSIDKAKLLEKVTMEPVVIGYMEGWRADGFIRNILNKFKSVHPNIPVIIHQLSDSELINGFKSGAIDIVFLHPEVLDEPSGFSFKTVYKAKLAIMLPGSLFGASGSLSNRLAKEPLIVISNERKREFIGYINLVHHTLGFKPVKIIAADTEESQLFMVDSGSGFALISDLSHTYGHPHYNFIETNYFREVIMLYKSDHNSPGCYLLLDTIQSGLCAPL